MSKVVIFGLGDCARMAHYYFEHDSEHKVVAFTVDANYLQGEQFNELPLVDFISVPALYPPDEYAMFIAIGYRNMNKARAEKYYQAKAWGYNLVSYVSSHCTFLSQHPVGDNCFILEDNTIQPFVRINNNVTLWSGNHIGHDSIIEDHCFLASQVVISGHVHIHPYCFIGVNATVHNATTINTATLVGAGATIVQDTIEQGVYVPPRSILLSKKSCDVHL